ncbi:MAG: Gfo/Idh/MocA family oxidoreductase [Verrucomicrobiota bacterium]|jgi:hypothetical protein|nr:Gfo/Idh/MocA family oxidoreductase [Verrucomicrobiota bacterium]
MKTDRRRFLGTAACAGGLAGLFGAAGCASLPGLAGPPRKSMLGFGAEPLGKIRAGIIGVGERGSAAAGRLAAIPNVEVRALCDLDAAGVDRQAKALTGQGRPAPARYSGASDAWQKLCESDGLDLIYICTPWLLHTPMAVYAMQCGKHAAVEVPAAMTVEQCWQLVDASEAARRHCVMLENSCYGETELLTLALCRKGLLGDLVHGEAAYFNDLRKGAQPLVHQKPWWLDFIKQHTGNPYPTHGLGPVCQCMAVNRGDRFEALTSMSSNQLGLTLAAQERFGKNSAEAKTSYRLGDMNTTLVRTYRGRTLTIQHSTTTPRPHSRTALVAGTRGVVSGDPLRVALDPKGDAWMADAELAAFKAKHAHPLWARHGGGGADFLMDLRLCHCLQNGLPPDSDVYDAALWSSVVELSERSAEREGAALKVPDFTRGGWKSADPLGIVTA